MSRWRPFIGVPAVAMRNLVKYAGGCLLVMGPGRPVMHHYKSVGKSAAAESRASGQPISLMDGKLSFTAGDNRIKAVLGTRANNIRLF